MGVDRAAGLDMDSVFDAVSNWGRWGCDDQRGALNLVAESQVAEATRLVQHGTVVSCSLELPILPAADNPMPVQHMMIIGGDASTVMGIRGLETALDYVGVAFHGAAVTHLDALCHMFVRGRMYNGRPASDVLSVGAMYNSIAAVADGVTGRGVLLDVPRLRGVDWLEPTEVISPEELSAIEESQGVRVGPGDILLVRTGRDARRAALGAWSPDADGLAGLDPRCVTWLSERDVAVLGSDGACDPLPHNGDSDWPLPIHQCCLVAMGVHLLDNLALTELADACARLERWAFLFSVAPLRIPGATGSPVNPLAVL